MAAGESVVGSILGYLRLDADQFHREIDKAIAATELLEHQSATVKVKADTSDATRGLDAVAAKSALANKGVSDFGGSFSRIPGGAPVLVGGIVAAIALIGPVAGTATAGVIGLTGVLGTSALAFQGFKNEIKQGTAVGQTFDHQLIGLKGTLASLERTSARAMAPGLLSGMARINGFLPSLNGEVRTLGHNLGNALDITTQGLISGLSAAMPLLQDGGVYAGVLAQKFADFAQSQDFRDFITYARAELPQVVDSLASLTDGAVQLAIALAPVGDDLLKITDATGKVTSKLGPGFGKLWTTPLSGLGLLHQAMRLLPEDSKDTTKAVADTVPVFVEQQRALTASARLYGTTSTALKTATDAQTKQADAAQQATLKMQLENDAAGILKQSLDALNGEALDAADAQNAFDSSLANMGDHVTAQGKKIHFTTKSITNMSAASVALRGQLNSQVSNLERVVEANGGLSDSTGKARAQMVKMRKQIIDNAVAHGVDRKAVTAYVDGLLKIPKKIPPTKLDVDKAQAQAKVKQLKGAIDSIPKAKSAFINERGAVPAKIRVMELHDAIERLKGKTVTVTARVSAGKFAGKALGSGPMLSTGGTVDGVGGPREDNIHAMLSAGEEVIRNGPAQKHRALLKAINADKFADGGTVGYAGGGTVTVPLGSYYSDYVSKLGPAVTRADLSKDAAAAKKAHDAQAAATDRLRLAEMKLDRDRHGKHTAYQIAADEARVANARHSLESATRKATTAQELYSTAMAKYRQQQRSPLSVLAKFQRGVNVGVKNTTAFIGNLEKLASRGYGTLASQLAAMGGEDAERIAAQAAGASTRTLGQIAGQVKQGIKNENTLSHIDGITAILQALRSSKGGARDLAARTGIDVMEILDSAAMIRGQLAKNKNASALLSDLAKRDKGQLFADGGIENHVAQIAVGRTRIWNEPETGGEAYIPLSPMKRARSLGIWEETGRRLGAGQGGGPVDLTDSTVARLAAAMGRVRLQTTVSAGAVERQVVGGMR